MEARDDGGGKRLPPAVVPRDEGDPNVLPWRNSELGSKSHLDIGYDGVDGGNLLERVWSDAPDEVLVVQRFEHGTRSERRHSEHVVRDGDRHCGRDELLTV